jgi:hypothetical protein
LKGEGLMKGERKGKVWRFPFLFVVEREAFIAGTASRRNL